MKILCVSDQIDPLVYSATAKERFADIDIVLCAGDLSTDYIDFIVSTLNKPTYFIFGNHNLNDFSFYHKNTVTSPGAHPVESAPVSSFDMSYSHGAVYAGFKVITDHSLMVTDALTGKKSPLLIAGISGSIRYNKGLNQYTDHQMFFKLLELVPALISNRIKYGRYLDIFLTHASPRHIHDQEDPCHRGFESFNWFISKFHPRYLVHGHIHLYDLQTPRVTVTGRTTVINAYSHYIIDTNGAQTEK
jgi:uncharacterized protein